MVTTPNDCENCIHKKVCSIKEQIEEVNRKALTEFRKYDDLIDISVRCKEFCSHGIIRDGQLT